MCVLGGIFRSEGIEKADNCQRKVNKQLEMETPLSTWVRFLCVNNKRCNLPGNVK